MEALLYYKLNNEPSAHNVDFLNNQVTYKLQKGILIFPHASIEAHDG